MRLRTLPPFDFRPVKSILSVFQQNMLFCYTVRNNTRLTNEQNIRLHYLGRVIPQGVQRDCFYAASRITEYTSQIFRQFIINVDWLKYVETAVKQRVADDADIFFG